jgi:hypothetical protein
MFIKSYYSIEGLRREYMSKNDNIHKVWNYVMTNQQKTSSIPLKSIPVLTKPTFITKQIKPTKKETIEFVMNDLNNSEVTIHQAALANSAANY